MNQVESENSSVCCLKVSSAAATSKPSVERAHVIELLVCQTFLMVEVLRVQVLCEIHLKVLDELRVRVLVELVAQVTIEIVQQIARAR